MDDTPVKFTRSSADLIGRTIKEFRGMGRGELPLPKRRRGLVGDGGGSGTVTTNFAKVTVEAAANGALPGKCIRLDGRLLPVSGDGTFVQTDPDDPEYDEDAFHAAEFEFYSAHKYMPCIVGSRIQWGEVAVTTGEDHTPRNLGTMVDPYDYFKADPSWGAGKIFWIPDDATAADDVEFNSESCDTGE